MKDFKNLKVWHKSIELVKLIYQNTKAFPKEEIFGIVGQMRRCVISIPSNIAEGPGRGTKKEFNHFLNIALGSAYELETQLIISNELNFIPNEYFNKSNSLLDEIRKMIFGLKKSLDK